METYYLNTLIFFLSSQQEMGYRGIKRILRLIDDDKISDMRKRKMLITLLRNLGLNEIGNRDGSFEPANIPENDTDSIVTVTFPTETLNIKLYNGALKLPVPLN